jgi:hypothetical protein
MWKPCFTWANAPTAIDEIIQPGIEARIGEIYILSLRSNFYELFESMSAEQISHVDNHATTFRETTAC